VTGEPKRLIRKRISRREGVVGAGLDPGKSPHGLGGPFFFSSREFSPTGKRKCKFLEVSERGLGPERKTKSSPSKKKKRFVSSGRHCWKLIVVLEERVCRFGGCAFLGNGGIEGRFPARTVKKGGNTR